jgi:hypothetical protein
VALERGRVGESPRSDPARPGVAGWICSLTCLIQLSCSTPCDPAYEPLFELPANVDAEACTLTLSGPAGSYAYSLAAPAPASEAYCSPLDEAPDLDCLRNPDADNEAQSIAIVVVPTAASSFEQTMGGTNFTVSLICGTTTVLNELPQSMGTQCEK